MTRDDIIRMAREAGYPDYVMGLATEAAWSQVLHFAALVAAAEREALKEERRRDMAEICSLRESEESLREENELLRADAERYRWLREESKKHPDFYSGEARWMVSCAQGGMGHNFFGEKIDAAIDAAMKEAALRREDTK